MKISCNLPLERRAEVFHRFTGSLSADEEDAIRGMFPQYLFFHNAEADDNGYGSAGGENVRQCYVTCCREGYEATRANYPRGKVHNEKVTCPFCGKTLTGKAVYKYRYSMPSLESWVKTAVASPTEDGGLLIEAGDARRRFTWDELEGVIDWYPSKRYYFNRGEVQMWYYAVIRWGCAEEKEVDWRTESSIKEPFAPNMMGYNYWDGTYRIVGLTEALERSSFKYCQLMNYYRDYIGADLDGAEPARYMVKYLAQYALHPQIEMAVKFGLHQAVMELVEIGRKSARLLNWDAKTPDAFLRMSKEDARSFLKNEMGFDDLKDWKETAKSKSLSEYIRLTESVGSKSNLREIAACAKKAGVELEKAARYVTGFGCLCWRGGGPPIGQVISTWKDYLDMAATMHYDLSEPTVAMPKNLQERHDAAAELIRHQANEAELKRYKKRRRMLEKKYAFAMGGLCVLIPTGSQEIVREGQTLHHCVGGYAKRHVDGAVTILFLRKERTPGRSFLTIELHEERGQVKIRQIHGYKNENYSKGKKTATPPREKYAWFLDAWLAWVNDGSQRDKEGRPVALNDQEVRTA